MVVLILRGNGMGVTEYSTIICQLSPERFVKQHGQSGGQKKKKQYVAMITIQTKYAKKLLLPTNLLQRNKDFSSFIPQNLDDIRIFSPSSLTVQRQQVATITYSVMHRFIQRHRFLPINFNIHAWHTPLT